MEVCSDCSAIEGIEQKSKTASQVTPDPLCVTELWLSAQVGTVRQVGAQSLRDAMRTLRTLWPF